MAKIVKRIWTSRGIAGRSVRHVTYGYTLMRPDGTRERKSSAEWQSEDAAEPWFRSLGAFYKIFEDYLDDSSDYGRTARQWRDGWQRRLKAIEAGDDTWPHFLVKAETTFAVQ